MPERLAETTIAMPRRDGAARRRDGWSALLLLGPNVALFTVFVGVPIVGASALSLFAWDLNGNPLWVGVANYTAMIHDPLVETSVKNTLYFVAMGVVPTVFIAL